MKNVFKGWVTTIMGLFLMVAGIFYWIGWMPFGIVLPEPGEDVIPKWVRLAVPFLVGAYFFFLGPTAVEVILRKLGQAVLTLISSLASLFTKSKNR